MSSSQSTTVVDKEGWDQFSASILEFLGSVSNGVDEKALLERIGDLYEICPGNPVASHEAKGIRLEIVNRFNDLMVGLVSTAIDSGEERLALFCIGLCDLGDDNDSVLEALLDMIDEGMNLSSLSTTYCPGTTFEANAILELIYWPDFPDWARAQLICRDDIGLVSSERSTVIGYLGSQDILGSDTLVAIARDISVNKSNYESSAVELLESFFDADFDDAAILCGADPDDLEDCYSGLGEYCINECRKLLGSS